MTSDSRSLNLGNLLSRLERAEIAGVSWCLHSSWCAEGTGCYVAIVRPSGWGRRALGVPVVGYDLLEALRRAVEIAE